MESDALPILRKTVVHFEGLHHLVGGMVYPYLCPAGYWTQGYGILCAKGAPPITPEEAAARLDLVLPLYIQKTLETCPRLWLESPERLASISDFTFNLGIGRLRASTLRKRLNDGDWEGVLNELPKWKYGGGRVLPGLVLRRQAEIDLIKRG